MALCPSFKIDSNDTGLRFAVEKCLKELPTLAVDGADPVWFPQEPNSYGDMGANITTVARNPINPSRQRQKGVITDMEATASYTMDLTGNNHFYFMQGFMFAHAREKPTTAPLNSAAVVVTGVTAADGYAMNDSFASKVAVGDLVLAEGFTNSANNGVKLVTAVDTGEVTVSGLVDEAAPPAGAKLTVVGVQAASADLAITVTGGEVRLTATTLNLTTLGLLPGEWIYLGGDVANSYFPNNRGFCRVGRIEVGYLVLDKVSWTPQAESGAGLTVQMYFGTVVRNEDNPANIVRSTFQFERTLGSDTNGLMSQYVIGSVANELTINVAQADKVTAEMGFIACDSVARTGLEGLKAGTRPPLVSSDAFNTSSDVRRLSFTLAGQASPLFVYATDLTLTIGNNASGLKAVGVLGNMDVAVGTFDVGGSVTAYFQDVRAVNAVRNNSDVSMDLILVKNNMGIVWDIPLMTLGNGMIAVEQDQAITVPLDMMAAQSSFGHTLLYVNFHYLPNAA